MSTPKKMNDNERKISNNLIKNITTLMLENEIYSDAECMRKIKENTGFDFNQSKFSDIKTGKTFPTTMELIAFSDFFNVSIDFLLGKERKETTLTIYETCKYIAKMFESDINLGCAAVPVEELYFDQMSGCTRTFERNYDCIYFSLEHDEINDFANPFGLSPHRKAERINAFIKKMIDMRKIKNTISKELYNKIIFEWLEEQKKYDKMTDDEYTHSDEMPFI